VKLDRVILATNTDPTYLSFVEVTPAAWHRELGVRATVVVIGADDRPVDAGDADVLRVAPIPGVDTGLHAQVIRLLAPALFPDDVCLLADIDMVPLNGRYFRDAVASAAADAFVVFRDRAYGEGANRYPICYNAALGSTFADVFDVRTPDDIVATVDRWAGQSLGWHTDELMLFRILREWRSFQARAVLLGGTAESRVDRSAWSFDNALVRRGAYIDAHLPRPYGDHRITIDHLLAVAASRDARARRHAWRHPAERIRDHARRVVRGMLAQAGFSLSRISPAAPAAASPQDQMFDTFGTHLIPLAAAVAHTAGGGPVLELGMGDYSTPLLHLLCKDRLVVSIETDGAWAARYEKFRSRTHQLHLVAEWQATALIESQRWSVALVDCAPATARAGLIERLRGRATFVVVHDTEADTDAAADYDMEPALADYRYRSDYRIFRPWTTIVSDERPFPLSAVESGLPDA
jgi:hypothetical protein